MEKSLKIYKFFIQPNQNIFSFLLLFILSSNSIFSLQEMHLKNGKVEKIKIYHQDQERIYYKDENGVNHNIERRLVQKIYFVEHPTIAPHVEHDPEDHIPHTEQPLTFQWMVLKSGEKEKIHVTRQDLKKVFYLDTDRKAHSKEKSKIERIVFKDAEADAEEARRLEEEKKRQAYLNSPEYLQSIAWKRSMVLPGWGLYVKGYHKTGIATGLGFLYFFMEFLSQKSAFESADASYQSVSTLIELDRQSKVSALQTQVATSGVQAFSNTASLSSEVLTSQFLVEIQKSQAAEAAASYNQATQMLAIYYLAQLGTSHWIGVSPTRKQVGFDTSFLGGVHFRMDRTRAENLQNQEITTKFWYEFPLE